MAWLMDISTRQPWRCQAQAKASQVMALRGPQPHESLWPQGGRNGPSSATSIFFTKCLRSGGSFHAKSHSFPGAEKLPAQRPPWSNMVNFGAVASGQPLAP